MIQNVISIQPTVANTIPAGSLVHLWDQRAAATAIVKCKGHTAHWSVFAFEWGETFRVRSTSEVNVVTNVQSWAGMDNDTRMDIELDLMTKGL